MYVHTFCHCSHNDYYYLIISLEGSPHWSRHELKTTLSAFEKIQDLDVLTLFLPLDGVIIVDHEALQGRKGQNLDISVKTWNIMNINI